MAQYYECDRCESKSRDSNHTVSVKLPYDPDVSEYNYYTRDLCGSCCKQLQKWIDDFRKVKSANEVYPMFKEK